VTACTQCGGAPELRKDEGRGLVMYACPGCLHHGGATYNERAAAAGWGLVNDPDLPLHKCAKATAPRFFQRSGAWGARCGCGLESVGFATIDGARAGWARELRE